MTGVDRLLRRVRADPILPERLVSSSKSVPLAVEVFSPNYPRPTVGRETSGSPTLPTSISVRSS
jgi:hypothetical protein